MDWITLIAIVTVIFAIVRMSVAIYNWATCKPLPRAKAIPEPTVDVLIPARNEAQNINDILGDLKKQTYKNFRVTIYNDQSTDETATIVKKHIQQFEDWNLIDGTSLPAGWSGKNHACYQLARHANAQLMLYLDADVRITPTFMHQAVSYFGSNNLKLLSFFPVQIMKTPAELLIVPLINWILLTLLPLKQIQDSKRTALAAANGQCMLFDTKVYQHHQWHCKVKSDPVEDIAIAKAMKKEQYAIATLLGKQEIYCRMYSNFKTAFSGFSRSAPAFFSYKLIWAGLFLIFVIPAPFFLLFTNSWGLIITWTIVIITTKLVVSTTSKQKTGYNLILHPAQMLFLLLTICKGFYNWLSKKYCWKNRAIKL